MGNISDAQHYGSDIALAIRTFAYHTPSVDQADRLRLLGQANGTGAPHCAHKEVLILVVLANTPIFSGASGPADWVGRICNMLS